MHLEGTAECMVVCWQYGDSINITTHFLLCSNARDNPLGMGGVMAKRYSELVTDLWSGHSKSITPLKFRVRNTVDCMYTYIHIVHAYTV